MARRLSAAAGIILLVLGRGLASAAEPGASPSASFQPGPAPSGGELIATGTVIEIHAPRLFSMRAEDGGGRVLLVLAPRPLSPDLQGAMVRVSGTLRWLDLAQLAESAGWRHMDERTRTRLSGRQVLVATSLLATIRRGDSSPPPADDEAEPVDRRAESSSQAVRTPLTIRASMLAANVDGLAGQDVRILNGRVVGLLERRAFLIEPATRYDKPLGMRDRLLVLIEDGALRVSAEQLVGAVVTVEGVARSVLGMQVTAEVPWPTRLDPEDVERLEIRGVVLARSVRTPEGTELTDRPAPSK